MQLPRPGSLMIGCWKSATPAVRAMIAGGESTWTRFVRQPAEKPAPSESPTHAMRVRSTWAAAGRATAAARMATEAAAETRRRREAGVFMFFYAPLERRLDRDARQDRERLVRGAEVVLARRDRPLVEPEEEARELELEVLRQGDPGPCLLYTSDAADE